MDGRDTAGGLSVVSCSRLALLCVLILFEACAQVIPVAPQFSASDMTQYFWSGTPYDPTYLVSSSVTPQSIADQVTIRAATTSLSLTDGIIPHGLANFTLSQQSITLDSVQPNNVYAFPGSAFLSDNVGVTYVTIPLQFQALLYTADGVHLIAGTKGNGIWHSEDDGNHWTQSFGCVNASITSLAELQDVPRTIYGISGDSIYYSEDSGKSFHAVADPTAPHTVIRSVGSIALAAGESASVGPNVIQIDPLTHQVTPFKPQFSSFAADSLLALDVSPYNKIIAGGYQKTSPSNHLFRCQLGDPVWTSTAFTSSSNVYALVNGGSTIFGGTSNAGIIYSLDQGQTWKPKTSTVLRSSNVTCMAWGSQVQSGFAGTGTGELLKFDAGETNPVTLYRQLSAAITALAYSPRGYLIAADGAELQSFPNGVSTVIHYSAIEPVFHPGSLILLASGPNGLESNSTWSAGYVLLSPQTAPKPLTARVVDHLDSLVLPLTVPKTALRDVFAIRYANENPDGTLVPALPYWLIYYAHSLGPVIIELLQNNGAATPPTVLNKAVYDPPY